eukprot:gene10077-20997_t
MASMSEFMNNPENEALISNPSDEESDSKAKDKKESKKKGRVSRFQCCKMEGKVHIIGEWKSSKQTRRLLVIGPDWPCVTVTYICIVVPCVLIYNYMIDSKTEAIIFYCLFACCLLALTAVVVSDPGLVKKYRNAKTRYWTYCDHCESFRPPGSVHCSTCQVCITGYDHHCPWTGKCIGGNSFGVFFGTKMENSCLTLLFLKLVQQSEYFYLEVLTRHIYKAFSVATFMSSLLYITIKSSSSA